MLSLVLHPEDEWTNHIWLVRFCILLLASAAVYAIALLWLKFRR